MYIFIENKFISPSIQFLNRLKLKGKESRARSKLVKILFVKLKQLADEEMTLAEEYGEKDDSGNFVYAPKDKGRGIVIDPLKVKDYLKEHQLLMDELVEISEGTYDNHLNELYCILEECTEELSGIDAEVYDRLLDAFESSPEYCKT